MKVTKTLFWLDRVWYDAESKQIVGDMGYTFCDAPETRTTNGKELVNGVISTAEDEFAENPQYLQQGNDFPIILIYKAKFTDEVEKGEEFYPWGAKMVEGTDKVVRAYAMTSKEIGTSVNLESIMQIAKISGYLG